VGRPTSRNLKWDDYDSVNVVAQKQSNLELTAINNWGNHATVLGKTVGNQHIMDGKGDSRPGRPLRSVNLASYRQGGDLCEGYRENPIGGHSPQSAAPKRVRCSTMASFVTQIMQGHPSNPLVLFLGRLGFISGYRRKSSEQVEKHAAGLISWMLPGMIVRMDWRK